MVTMYRRAFPDLRMTVDDVIATDDKVVLRWHSSGPVREAILRDVRLPGLSEVDHLALPSDLLVAHPT